MAKKGVTGVVKGFDDISWHVYHTGSKCDVFFSRLLCSVRYHYRAIFVSFDFLRTV